MGELTSLLDQGESVNVICLGIGNFTDSVQAKYQLALLHLLVKSFKTPLDKVRIFDPHFTESEVRFLRLKLGYSLASNSAEDNLEGRHTVDGRTLVFLPHCPKQLTNNLLFANWCPEKLDNLTLFSNSLEGILLSQPERILIQQVQ